MMSIWYTTRGAGLAMLITFSIATSLGALASVPSARLERRFLVQYVHRAAAVFGLLLLVVHVGTVLIDAKAKVGVVGALVPFASSYRPNAVALGSIAAYLMLLIVATGLARGRMARSARGARTWRYVHLLAYVSWGVAVVHGLLAGTDAGLAWVRVLVAACVFVVAVSLAVRINALKHVRVEGRLSSLDNPSVVESNDLIGAPR